jgi:hypothetical protein
MPSPLRPAPARPRPPPAARSFAALRRCCWTSARSKPVAPVGSGVRKWRPSRSARPRPARPKGARGENGAGLRRRGHRQPIGGRVEWWPHFEQGCWCCAPAEGLQAYTGLAGLIVRKPLALLPHLYVLERLLCRLRHRAQQFFQRTERNLFGTNRHGSKYLDVGSSSGCPLSTSTPPGDERREVDLSRANGARLYTAPVDYVTVMLAEYNSVRVESMEALNQIHTIVQYGLASIGVSVGLGLVTSQHSTTAAAMVLMGLIPTLIVFGVTMMAVAVHRVVQTRQYLRYLEAEISRQLPKQEVRVPSWERTRKEQDHAAVNGYPFAIFASIGTASVLGPGLGGYLLASHHLWPGFVVGEILDIGAISVFAARCARTYRRIVTYSRSELVVAVPDNH